VEKIKAIIKTHELLSSASNTGVHELLKAGVGV
jgi:hypothetical protein